MVLASLPEAWRVLPMLPLWVERAVALLLGLWFVNLVNFMDGIDGLLVIGLAPALLAIGTGLFGLVPVEPLAALLAGALCGFLVLNRPKAMLFAGDVGSLSVALVTAVLLYRFAAAHSLSAAIILPLYFVMDATHTLLMRALRRANLAEAHRDHAYQHALDAGMPAARIIGEVLLLNAFLAMLAACATTTPGFDVLWLALALATTGGLIVRFRGRERR